MLIFFGARGRIVKGRPVEGYDCSQCGCEEFNSYGRIGYFHIYFIPMFLTSRKPGMQCAQCGNTYENKNLPLELRERIKSELFSVFNIAPMFTGLILIAMLIMFASITIMLEGA